MDFENISINVDESKVSKISQKCQELQELEKVIALKKIELSEVEDKANNLQNGSYPT